MKTIIFIFIFASLLACNQSNSNTSLISQDSTQVKKSNFIKTGCQNLIDDQIDILKDKKVAIIANSTSLYGDSVHLVDALLAKGIQIKKIFAPEHGFRGDIEAGKYFQSDKDEKTGLPIISLYGKKMKPSTEDLKGIDILIFDIQDVGCRFYTFLTTMTFAMEACAENNVQFMLLDRPNPNGWYTGGPVMKKSHVNYAGIHQVPIVHGLTLGEYAQMAKKEKWLKTKGECDLKVVWMKNYKHSMRWSETGLKWSPPSPNLQTTFSSFLYPILCWYEGTIVSVGRGTENSFEQIGFPFHQAFHKSFHLDSINNQVNTPPKLFTILGLEMIATKFTPISIPNRAAKPMYKDEACYGLKFKNEIQNGDTLFLVGLELLTNFYKEYKEYRKEFAGSYKEFFNPYFNDLLGNDLTMKQIKDGKTPKEIYDSWLPELAKYRILRQKHLFYP